MIKHVLFDLPLEDEEVWRINRAQAALILHKTPKQIDRMSYTDVADVMGVHAANQELSRRRGG